MGEPEIPQEWVQKAATAMVESRPIPDGCYRGDVNWTFFHEVARAALAAVIPLIRADERAKMDDVVDAAGDLVSLYRRLHEGKPVRNLDEAEVAYASAVGRASAIRGQSDE